MGKFQQWSVHIHVQTNDARILPRGTAYLTDVGMTGPYDGILGMRREPVIEKFLTALPKRFEVVEQGRSILSGCILNWMIRQVMQKKSS